MGWMAEGEEGYGVAGLLDGDLDMEASVEVAGFGLKGDLIQLVMVLHRTGGVVPESVKAFVRRKMGLAEGLTNACDVRRCTGGEGRGKEGALLPVSFRRICRRGSIAWLSNCGIRTGRWNNAMSSGWSAAKRNRIRLRGSAMRSCYRST